MCFKITSTIYSSTITMDEVQEAKEGVQVTISNLPVKCLFHTENKASGLARARDPEPGKDRDRELFKMAGIVSALDLTSKYRVTHHVES